MLKRPSIQPPEKAAVILVVEDEPLVRMLAADVLGDEGFVIIEAGDADEALYILQSEAIRVDALFTDVHMPGSINGLALAHHTDINWPWIAILIASGAATPLSGDMPNLSRFFPKPYDIDHIAAQLRHWSWNSMIRPLH